MTRSCTKIKDAILDQPSCRHHQICLDIHRIVIDSDQIHQTVQSLAQQIQHTYAGHRSVVVPFLLKGARRFAQDLETCLDNEKFEFVPVQVSSYCGGTRSTGKITLDSDSIPDVTGQSVLIVDDIYDSGLTLERVITHFEAKGAAGVRTCVMFEKDCQHVHEVPVDFVGLSVPDVFVVGYGLDYQDRYRELHCVGILRPEILAS